MVLEDAEEDFAGQLLPVMLERSGLLFDLPDFKADVIMYVCFIAALSKMVIF